jgi:cell division protein FtsL
MAKKKTKNKVEVSENYKFGDNNAVIYSGKPENRFMKKVNQMVFSKFNLINYLCTFLIAFLGINIAQTLSVELNLHTQTESLKKERESVRQEQNKLKKQIKFYRSSEGIEKIARESLGLIKSDEIPVRYIERK